MKRLFGLVVATALFAGCDKPSEEDCRKAIANMRSIHGTEDPTVNADPDVRRCKGASSKKAVKCAIAAKTMEELSACGFAPKSASGSGSAAAPAGSAAAPAPAGSAAPAPAGSAAAPAGSAAPPAPPAPAPAGSGSAAPAPDPAGTTK